VSPREYMTRNAVGHGGYSRADMILWLTHSNNLSGKGGSVKARAISSHRPPSPCPSVAYIRFPLRIRGRESAVDRTGRGRNGFPNVHSRSADGPASSRQMQLDCQEGKIPVTLAAPTFYGCRKDSNEMAWTSIGSRSAWNRVWPSRSQQIFRNRVCTSTMAATGTTPHSSRIYSSRRPDRVRNSLFQTGM
jgi:hypothetical protein